MRRVFFRHTDRSALVIAATLVTLTACAGSTGVPATSPAAGWSQASSAGAFAVSQADDTSILKKLTKDVVIGSTVDPTNGDTGPRALSVAPTTYGGLKKGQLLVCNFSNASGTPGAGTTVDVLDPRPGSKPATWVQNSKIAGCDGNALSAADSLYAAGLSSGVVAHFTQKGKYVKSYGAPLKAPFDDADLACSASYSAEYVFASDSTTGSVVSFSVNGYGAKKPKQVIAGFAVNNGTGWSVLGPSGIQYNGKRKGSGCFDIAYFVDGVDDTIVAVSHASSLLVKDEIIIKPGGKTFKCKYPKTTCATLVYSGSPLNAPVASALLPNGNLVVANTKGGNKLVEITAAGKLLATKTIDKSKTAHVFGLLATGTDDSNTALFYTDTADNTLHELEQ